MTAAFPAGHKILDAQRNVFNLIDENGYSHFGILEANGCRVRDVLESVRSIANRVLNYASIHGLAEVKSVDVAEYIAQELTTRPSRARSALNERAPTRAIETAVAVVAAIEISDAPDIQSSGIRAQWAR